jgi:peptidyl-prolyl cis-trans isomerase B (cyclophilin B)
MRAIGLWCCVVCVAAWCGETAAQLTPERLYCGVGRRVLVRVEAPDDFVGELTIRLHEIADGSVVAEAAAAVGRADLAGLLAVLWEAPAERARVAQLYADDKPLGPPVVVQPMWTPVRALLVDPATGLPSDGPGAAPAFENDLSAAGARSERVFTGLRLYVHKEVVFETSEGLMAFRLRPDEAPNTAFNLLHLVEGGFYTDVIVHRVVAALPDGRPFVVQFGDPSDQGSGGPGYHIDLERSGLGHGFVVLSMARGADPNSNGSQVFIGLSREGTSFLDGRYTAFAELVEGAGVLRAIAGVEVGEDGRPVAPPVVTRAYTRDASGVAAPSVSASVVED